MTGQPWYCWHECPHNGHRHCNVGPLDHAGDHAFLVDFGRGPVVVASWPGAGSKVQSGPTRDVTL